MRTNGTLEPAIIAEAINDYGETCESTTMWGDANACCITTNTDTRIGKYEDGEFRMSAYTILLTATTPFFDALVSESGDIVMTQDDKAIVVKIEGFNLERVRLTRYGEDLGEFRVQSYEIFPRVGRIQIRVV